MGERPYRARGLGELEAMAHAVWDDPSRLAAVAGELASRGPGPAGALRRRVEARMGELAPPPAGEGEDVVALLLAVETLKARLAVAQKEIDVQRYLIDGLKSELGALQRAAAGDLYAKVHARPSIPDFALRALRSAYRRAFHPDAKPPGEREAALRAFVEYEAVFQAIDAARAGRDAA